MYHTAQWIRRWKEKSQRLDRILQRAISIRIILPEDAFAAKSTGEPAVRHSGDEIRGHLEVMTRGNFEFEVGLSFEGLISSNPPGFSYH